jgi:putative ABC transport system substrate-binding protein
VQLGLVASLNRPGGNITGVANLTVEVGPKRLELLHELMPAATVFALIANPTSPLAQIESRDLLKAARGLGLELHVLPANSERDFDEVFSRLIQLHAAALLIATDGLFLGRSDRLATLAMRHSIPTMASQPELAVAGGLISYGSSANDGFRLAGVYTGRILRGEKPSEMPVQQSTKIELAINLKTAKALGLTVPPTLLARADEVIE